MTSPPASVAAARLSGTVSTDGANPYTGDLAKSAEAKAWQAAYDATKRARLLRMHRFHVKRLNETIERATEILAGAKVERAEALVKIDELTRTPADGQGEAMKAGARFWRIDRTPTTAHVEVEIGETLESMGAPSGQRYRLRWSGEAEWHDRSGSRTGLREWYEARIDPPLEPGRYRSPDDVEGELYPFDHFAGCYRFAPDGHVPPAVVGPGFPDGLTRFGAKATAGWTKVGE